MEDQKQTEKNFYTRTELEEFKLIIEAKLAESKREERKLEEGMRELGGNSVDSINFTEFGNESRDKEQIEIMMARQQKFIHSLEKALHRIENGTYGICRNTGKLIPKERLRLVPHATTTVEGKMAEQRPQISPNSSF